MGREGGIVCERVRGRGDFLKVGEFKRWGTKTGYFFVLVIKWKFSY